jgi:hypothetical protein
VISVIPDAFGSEIDESVRDRPREVKVLAAILLVSTAILDNAAFQIRHELDQAVRICQDLKHPTRRSIDYPFPKGFLEVASASFPQEYGYAILLFEVLPRGVLIWPVQLGGSRARLGKRYRGCQQKEQKEEPEFATNCHKASCVKT